MEDNLQPVVPEELGGDFNPENVEFCPCCGQYYYADDMVCLEDEDSGFFAACKQCGDYLLSTQTEQRYFFRYKIWYGHLQFRTEDNVQSFDALEEIKGGLDIRYAQTPSSLGKLKRIAGKVNLIGTAIEDLSPLEYVGSTLTIDNSKVRDLGSLQYVGEDIRTEGCPLESLGNLKHVGNSAYLSGTNISSFSTLEHVGGKLYATNTRISDLGNLQCVGSVIDISGTRIQEVDRFEDTKYYIGLANNAMGELGAIKHVGGILLENTEIGSLSHLESVDDSFLGKGLKTISLCELKYVGGTMDLRNSTVEDLGALNYVGGNLYLPARMRGLPRLERITVKGITRFYK